MKNTKNAAMRSNNGSNGITSSNRSNRTRNSQETLLNWIKAEQYVPIERQTEKTVKMVPMFEATNEQILRAYRNRNRDVFSWLA